MLSIKKTILLLILPFFFNCFFSQNIGDTTSITIGNSKILIINKNNEDSWDFSDEALEKEEKEKKLTLKSEILIGSAGYLSSSNEFSLPIEQKKLALNNMRSNSFSINSMLKGLDIFKKRMYFSPGYGICWNNYFFKNPIQISFSNDTTRFEIDTVTDFKKYKLQSTYLQIPIIFGFRIGNLNKKTFGVQFGGVISYNLRSKIISKYYENDTYYNIKIIDSFNLNPFKLSVISRLSIGKLGFFANYSFSSLFIKNKTPIVYPYTFGVIIGSF